MRTPLPLPVRNGQVLCNWVHGKNRISLSLIGCKVLNYITDAEQTRWCITVGISDALSTLYALSVHS
jgi:hypothetical protein